MKWYLLAFEKYADFSGRSRRSEFWYFQLFNMLIVIGGMMLAGILLSILGSENLDMVIMPFFFVFVIYYLITLIPSFALIARRLHDTGRSGWWFLISFIPLVGPFILLFFYCEDSQYGPNQWGPNPKEVGRNISRDPTILDDLV